MVKSKITITVHLFTDINTKNLHTEKKQELTEGLNNIGQF